MASKREALVAELKVEQAAVARVEAVLRQSLREVTADLRRLRGNTTPSAVVERAQLEATRAAIRARLANGFQDIETILAGGHQDAARAASAVMSKYESPLLKRVLGAEMPDVLATSEAQRAAAGVESAIRRVAGQTYKPLSGRVYDTRKLASGYVDNLINTGLARGWSWQRLARELRTSINPATPGGVSYAAKRLARTEINNAFHASTIARAKATGIVEKMVWNLSSSHPEGDECDDYKDRSPYDIDKVPAKPHPQCYCYLTSELPDEDEFLDNLFAGKYDPEEGFDSPYEGEDPIAHALRLLKS